MAQYWTCRYGANHDPGEKCDCMEGKEKTELEKKLFWQARLNIPAEAGQLSFKLEPDRSKEVRGWYDTVHQEQNRNGMGTSCLCCFSMGHTVYNKK